MSDEEQKNEPTASITIEEYEMLIAEHPRERINQETLKWRVSNIGVSDEDTISVVVISVDINFN